MRKGSLRLRMNKLDGLQNQLTRLARKKLVSVIIAVLVVGILVLYETDVATTNNTHTVTATIGSTTSYSIGYQ